MLLKKEDVLSGKEFCAFCFLLQSQIYFWTKNTMGLFLVSLCVWGEYPALGKLELTRIDCFVISKNIYFVSPTKQLSKPVFEGAA